MNNVQWFSGDAAGNVKSTPALLQYVPSPKHFKDALTLWAASHNACDRSSYTWLTLLTCQKIASSMRSEPAVQ